MKKHFKYVYSLLCSPKKYIVCCTDQIRIENNKTYTSTKYYNDFRGYHHKVNDDKDEDIRQFLELSHECHTMYNDLVIQFNIGNIKIPSNQKFYIPRKFRNYKYLLDLNDLNTLVYRTSETKTCSYNNMILTNTINMFMYVGILVK